MDLFHCESATLRTHWVLVLMDVPCDWRSRKQAARFQDLLQQPSQAYLTGRANAGYAGVTTDQSRLVSMAAPLPILVSNPNGCLTLSKTRAHFGIRSTSKNDWNEIIRYLRSWLQSVSRIRSFHCHQIGSKRERHLPFAARFAGNIGPRSNSPATGGSLLLKLGSPDF